MLELRHDLAFRIQLKHLYGLEIKLSEMHTAYWEYVEKARRYIGNTATRSSARVPSQTP